MKIFSLLVSVFLLYTLQWTTFVEARSPLLIRSKIPFNIIDATKKTIPLKNCGYRYWLEKPVIFCEMGNAKLNNYYIAFSVTVRPEKDNDKCKITPGSKLIAYKLRIGKAEEATDIAYIPLISMIKNKKVIYPRKGEGVLYVRDASQNCRFALTYNVVHIEKKIK